MVIITKIFLEIILLFFWIKTSLGLKFCKLVYILCISLRSKKLRWIHLKKILSIYYQKIRKKLFVFECKTSSFIDTPESQVRHPSFHNIFGHFRILVWATRSPAFTNFGK
jgi:hypothetical protein